MNLLISIQRLRIIVSKPSYPLSESLHKLSRWHMYEWVNWKKAPENSIYKSSPPLPELLYKLAKWQNSGELLSRFWVSKALE